jgi:predicted transcriptional regulator
MNSRQQLLDEIEAFMAAHAMVPADFGTLAFCDVSFVYKLRKGRDVRSSTADRARKFMREHKPKRPLGKRRATTEPHSAA